jgi:hypothetical protein
MIFPLNDGLRWIQTSDSWVTAGVLQPTSAGLLNNLFGLLFH